MKAHIRALMDRAIYRNSLPNMLVIVAQERKEARRLSRKRYKHSKKGKEKSRRTHQDYILHLKNDIVFPLLGSKCSKCDSRDDLCLKGPYPRMSFHQKLLKCRQDTSGYSLLCRLCLYASWKRG